MTPDEAMAAVDEATRHRAESESAQLDAFCRARLAGIAWESIGNAVGLTETGIAKAVRRHEREGAAASRRLATKALSATQRGKAWPAPDHSTPAKRAATTAS